MKKIAIIGPESTGKSTLGQKLAAHFQTVYCPEYAREYLLKNGSDYSFHDLLLIARGQVQLEDKLLREAGNGIYFIDTEMYVMKVWCEVVFEQCHKWILQQVALRKYDHYLLCNVDLPWQKDALREYPDLQTRTRLFKMYMDCVIHSGTSWTLIEGTGEERLQKAIEAAEAIKA